MLRWWPRNHGALPNWAGAGRRHDSVAKHVKANPGVKLQTLGQLLPLPVTGKLKVNLLKDEDERFSVDGDQTIHHK